MNIGFLTRGHGFGHAARDLRLIRAIGEELPGTAIDVMSSGSGLRYYRDRGVDCADLAIPDEADLSSAASWAVWRRLARDLNRWDLVIADEVVSAVPFAHHILEVPVVVLTDWFFRDFGKPHLDRVFDQATEVIVLDFAESHPRPPETTAPVHHAGPVVQAFDTGPGEARAAIGADPAGFVAVLTLGGMPDRPEADRMTAAVLEAWERFARPDDRLYVLAGARGRASAPGVRWVGTTTVPERYYAAADTVLVDAMGFTSCELVFNDRRVLGLTDALTMDRFPESFHHRLSHMAAQGWLRTVEASCDRRLLWELIAGSGSGSGAGAGAGAGSGAERPGTPLWAADLNEIARRVLKHG